MVILAAAVLCHPVSALTVRPARGWSVLWAVPVQPGDEMRITWTHSVSGWPVAEKFTILSDGRLCLVEMVFDHEGPNLPSWPEEETSWRFEEGRAVVTGYQRCLAGLNLAVSPFGHRMVTTGWNWDLVAAVGPDRLIRVECERIPLFLVYWAEVMQWRHRTIRS